MFFFNDTATTEIYTLSLHDALPIFRRREGHGHRPRRGRDDAGVPASVRAGRVGPGHLPRRPDAGEGDRKSTRLNSSHANISYAVICLKKKYILVMEQ